jgi:hypothetical protein
MTIYFCEEKKPCLFCLESSDMHRKKNTDVYICIHFFSLRLLAIVTLFCVCLVLPSLANDRQLRRKINNFTHTHTRHVIDASVTVCMNDCQRRRRKKKRNGSEISKKGIGRDF